MLELYQDIVKICDIGLIMGAPVLDNFCGKLANKICTEILPQKSEYEDTCIPAKKSRQDLQQSVSLSFSDNISVLSVEHELPIEDFVDKYKSKSKPVVIKGAISHWPALSENSIHRWNIHYIKNIAGYRTVPVELGSKYTHENWSQTLMTLHNFIDKYVNAENPDQIGYLAQHNLFDQISELKDDFDIPEYCLTGEEDDVVINVWFGPSKTVSPLHTDPKHNCLCQVFGRKYIRLYTADQSALMSAFEDGILTNTSQIDLEEDENTISKKCPEFSKAKGYECILDEGDILYIPPKCWHFVKSLSVSCSLSFWFE